MFKSLTNNLNKIFDKLRSRGSLSESDINSAMREIRVALLEADVALPVVRDFIAVVGEKAVGTEVIKSVTPGQMIVKIVQDELTKLLSAPEEQRALNLKAQAPVSIMIVGLQGSGKTTSTGKLASYLKAQGKKVLLVSLDIYRPAAQQQLEILAKSINVNSLPIITEQKPVEIAKRALTEGKLSGYDVILFDTAGRLHIDQALMQELQELKSLVKPSEIMLVADSMTGQDAVNIATEFNNQLGITAVVLTRIDGDARAGAALSIRQITGAPIKFLGTGEKIDQFEEFHAERIASRILGMGDVVSLVEKAAKVFDEQEAEALAKKIKKGKFNFEDFLSQIRSVKKMGGLSSMLSMLPGVDKIKDKLGSAGFDDSIIKTQEAIILSMTKKERIHPNLINASRKIRIAAGSGTSVQEVNKVLRQFQKVEKMVKKMSKMNPAALARGGLSNLFS